MIACMIGDTGLGQVAARRDEAVDRSFWLLLPTDVEGRQLGEELQVAVWEVVMKPLGHGLPPLPS
jgi:hypothetical protein